MGAASSIHIRDASDDDLEIITAIYRECVERGTATYELVAPDMSEMKRRFQAITIQRGCPYIVAEDADGAVLGYAYGSAFRDRPAYNWLVEDSIYLAATARGKGVGKALLEELLSRCGVLGFRQMVAVIGGADPASIGVHRSCGFAMIGTMPATGYKFGRWLDTVLMQKPLGAAADQGVDPSVYPGTIGISR